MSDIVTTTPQPLGLDELDELCTTLLALPGVLDNDTRDMYVAELTERMPDMARAPRFPDPLHDVRSLVTTGRELPGAIRALVVIVCRYHQGTPQVSQLMLLAEQIDPVQILEARERLALVELLGQVPVATVASSYRYAAPAAPIYSTVDWQRVETVVTWIESLVLPSESALVLLRFADHVAHQLSRYEQARVHDWIYAFCRRLEFTDRAVDRLCEATVARLRQVNRYYLIAHLAPHPVLTDHYLLSAALQRDREPEQPFDLDDDLVTDEPLSLREAVKRLTNLVDQAPGHIQGTIEEFTVELVLPRALIHVAADRWRIGGPLPHHLGAVHPVVIRSLDRLKTGNLHPQWERRCRLLSRHADRTGTAGVRVVTSDDPEGAESLRAGLVKDPIVVLVAGFPPAESADLLPDALTACLSAGVPVMVWCREPRLGEEFVQRIRAVLAEYPPGQLPYQVFQLRLEADQSQAPEHVGHHITLLWDDYDRLPAPYGRRERLMPPRQREGLP